MTMRCRSAWWVIVLVAALAGAANGSVASAATGSRSDGSSRGALPYGAAQPVASCKAGKNLDGGRGYRVEIRSRIDGAPVVFQLFEPDRISCAKRHPLVLEGHGFSGTRRTDKRTGALGTGLSIADLTRAGYAVVSIDQRGHGESGGTIRVMDPDFEGRDLVAIVDWAEQHLDYLAYRRRNLLLGSIGGSYGGGYQLLLYAVDPDRRLDAIVPEITWHDLTYSLAPNGVVKSYWALFLAGAGEANTGASMDPFLRATLLEGGTTNRMPGAALPFLNYHSLSYFCDNPYRLVVGAGGNTGRYTLDPLTKLLPVTAEGRYLVKTPPFARVPKVDALLIQGVRDDLFNFNEAYRNYRCLKRGGGDVRLLTYESGHQLLSPGFGFVADTINAGRILLEGKCGPIDAKDAALVWFAEKLKDEGDADTVVTTDQDVCYALSPGDAVRAPAVTVGGRQFQVELQGGLPATVTLGDPVPVIAPIGPPVGEKGEVIAGIPTATLKISRGDPALDAQCRKDGDPLLNLGACDAVVFVQIGSGLGGRVPRDLDEQIIPVRGVGTHEIELAGVAERLTAGEQLAVVLFGAREGFVTGFSRDATTPAVTVTGTVRVPLLGPLPKLTASKRRARGGVARPVFGKRGAQLTRRGAKRGTIRLTLVCATGRDCDGTLTLRHARNRLGRLRFGLTADSRKIVRLRVSKPGRTQLARRGRLRVRFVAQADPRPGREPARLTRRVTLR
jgi:ABC-2 type transport system ATP-binding protein